MKTSKAIKAQKKDEIMAQLELIVKTSVFYRQTTSANFKFHARIRAATISVSIASHTHNEIE